MHDICIYTKCIMHSCNFYVNFFLQLTYDVNAKAGNNIKKDLIKRSLSFSFSFFVIFRRHVFWFTLFLLLKYNFYLYPCEFKNEGCNLPKRNLKFLKSGKKIKIRKFIGVFSLSMWGLGGKG